MDKRGAEARFIGITVEALLRPCEIYPVRTASGNGFVWEWSAILPDVGVMKALAVQLFFEIGNVHL